MRAPILLLASVALLGCSLIVNPRSENAYDLVDSGRQDGGPARDSGTGRDSGPGDSGCVNRTYFLDRDGDGYGDPATAIEQCEPPAHRHAPNGDDCDDSRDDVHPGATEMCDDVDQDCDGSIDEELMGPLGEPIEVVPDVGASFWSSTVAHDRGVAVFWRTDAEDIIRGSFFDRGGSSLALGVFVRGNGTRSQVAARFTTGGLDQIAIAWIEPTAIRAQLCSTSGSCSTPRAVLETDTTELRELRIAQLGDRLIARWTEPDGLQMVSMNPATGVRSAVLTVPPVEGTVTQFHGLAPVNAGAPRALVGRVTARVDGGVVTEVRAAIVRVNGIDSLSHDEEADVFEWDFSERCGELGMPTCFPASLGTATRDDSPEELFMYEALLASGSGDPTRQLCLLPFRLEGSLAEVIGSCIPLDDFAASTLRGPLLSVVRNLGSTYAFREIAISSVSMGSDFVSLPTLNSAGSRIHGLVMHRAHGGITASVGGGDLSLLRLGCAPM